MAIKNGTIVWLKTGGPAMCVRKKYRRDAWICTWFIGSEVKEHYFNEEQLTETEPKILASENNINK